MELSELVSFNGELLAPCDYTGIVYKIHPNSGRIFQRWALADGNSDEPKPFKGDGDGERWTSDHRVIGFSIGRQIPRNQCVV